MLAPAIRALLVIWLCALGLAVSVCAQAQRGEVTFEDAKARLLGAVLDNTTWPDEESFDEFIKAFPDDDLSPQALFWAGESYRLAKNIPLAFRRYNRCRWDFPESEAAKFARGLRAVHG